MTDKKHRKSEEKAREATRTGQRIDPDDDVTSELSDLVARALGDRKPPPSGKTRVIDMQLVSHTDTSADEALEAGTLLNNRFELIELVHSGGMGHVYKAVDRRRAGGSEESFVAVKMLRRSLSDRDEFRLLLEREASKARSLSHPNIINIFDFDADGDHFFLVMEWLRGESLNALLRRTRGQRLSPAFAHTVIDSVAEAVLHAHQNNVIHADINPSNIFVTETQEIKLLDFGIARYGGDADKESDAGPHFVTQSYSSPEVLSGLPPEFQDDVFSLGCVAYRLLGGEHPFNGKPSILARQEGIVVDSIPGLTEHEWSVLSRSLAYSRSERPDSVEAFLLGPSAAPQARTDESGPIDGILRWGLPLVAAIVVAFAFGWWSRQPDVAAVESSRETVLQTNDEVRPETSPAAEPATPAERAPIDAMLASAEQAAQAEQLIVPEGSSARDWYRSALAAEPGNLAALQGLRSISDTFVQRANEALDSDDPQAAETALTIASDTDASNPAIGIVNDLLRARGDAWLAAAQAATANAEINAANAALAEAERYTHIDPAAVNSMREQIAAVEREASFLEDLTIAENHIATGRLLEPTGTNALESLAEISDTYGTDPRLDSASRRLAVQLLAQARIATADDNLLNANAFIDAAESLDVLGPEIESAREAVVIAARRVAAAEATATRPADEQRSEPADSEASQGAAAEVATSLPASDQAASVTGRQPAETSAASDGREALPGLAAETSDYIPALSNTNDVVNEPSGPARVLKDGLDVPAVPLDSDAGEAPPGSELIRAGAQASTLYAASGANATRAQEATAPPVTASDGDLTQPSPTGSNLDPAQSQQSTAKTLQDLGLERFVAPKYPRAAKRRGLTGFVELQFDVTPDGKTEGIEVLRGVPEGVFDGNAARAVRQWRFDTRPEAARGYITLRFEITD